MPSNLLSNLRRRHGCAKKIKAAAFPSAYTIGMSQPKKPRKYRPYCYRCSGGPFHDQHILLTGPMPSTAFFKVGGWYGRYVHAGIVGVEWQGEAPPVILPENVLPFKKK